MKNFFKSRGFKVLVVVFLLLFGILIHSVVQYGVSGTVDGVVGIVVTPLQKAATAVKNFAGDFFSRFSSKDELQQQIEALEQELADLRGRVTDYDQLKRENEQMQALLELKEANQDMTFQMAEVTARSTDGWSSKFTIDRGSLDGVALYDPVITKESYLVGYVCKVGPTWATVVTLFDSSIAVGATLSSTRDVGTVENSLETASEGLCRMLYLPGDHSVPRGETAITSGSARFPKGLLIGTVESSEQSSDGLTTIAYIRPFADIPDLRDVFVVTSFRGQAVTADDVEDEVN